LDAGAATERTTTSSLPVPDSPFRDLNACAADDRALFRASVTSRRTVLPHCGIVREGDVVTGMLLVLEGWAMRYRQRADGSRQILAILLPGDLCIDPPGKRLNHTIASLTQVRFGIIPFPHFDEAAPDSSDLLAALWRRQLEMSSIQLEWIANGGRSAYERIAHFLCETFSRARACGLAEGNRCEFPLTQQDIACVTGLTSVHVNRTLQQMRKDGLIELQGKRLSLLKPEGLGRAAAFDSGYLARG
jgi:CRP-like cAMP-binding protein